MIVATHSSPGSTSRPVVLWVEDALMKEYLSRIWQPEDASFDFRIGGGCDTIRGSVNDARRIGNAPVFGLVDRDFGTTNKNTWRSPDTIIFRPPVLEYENFMLSWEAMAGCSQNKQINNRSVEKIQERAEKLARRMVYWMACRDVLSQCQRCVTDDFPKHPSVDELKSRDDITSYVASSNWYGSLGGAVDSLLDSNKLTAMVEAAVDKANEQLEDETWISEFSGKEIFQDMMGYVMQKSSRSKKESKVGQGTENQEENEPKLDFAKSIADWQVANDRVPLELLELKTVLLERVGLRSS